MQIKNILFFKIFIITLLLLVTACEDKKPEVSVTDHLDLAHLYFKQDSFKASIIEGNNALQIEPNNIEALTTISTILLKLNEGNAASNLLKKAIGIDNENQNLKLLLAKAYLLERKVFSARNIFKSIDSTAIKNISDYQILNADLLLTSNSSEDAKIWYIKAHESDKHSIEAIIGIAKTSLLLKQPKEVNKYTTLAIETSPTDIDALLWQAHVLMLQKKFAQAENILSRSLIEFERYDTLTANKYAAIEMLAKALIAQGKVKESFTYSNYLAQSQPGQVQASYKYALNLISKDGNLIEAEKAFQNVLKQAPRHKSSGIILGLINYEKGNYTQAEDYLSKFSNSENSPLRSKKILILTKIKLNKINEAIKIITENIERYNDDADLHALLGFAYLSNKKIDKSIQSLKHAIELSSKNSTYHTNLARAYLFKKETKQAIKEANLALEIKPDFEQAKMLLVSAYAIDKNFTKAKAISLSWLKQHPKSIPALNVSASLELELKNNNEAKTQFLKVLTIEPYNLIANMNLLKFELKESKLDKAVERLSLIINKNPENSQALNILFKLTVTKNITDKGIDIIKSVNTKHPSAVNSRLILAQLYLSKKSPEKALIIIDDITKLDNKNTQAYLLQAKALLLQNNIKEAESTYLLLASLTPKSPVAYAELGRLNIKQKKYKTAILYANKALTINKIYVPAHLILAIAGMNTNDKPMARKSISIIKKETPKSHLPYEMEADLYLKEKNYKKAIQKLKDAWRKHHNMQLANKFLNTYTLTKQSNIAFDAWDELSKKNKNNVKLQTLYAFNLQKANKFKKAKIILESQLNNYPKNAVLLNNLANLYLETNNTKALKTAQKALAIHPDSTAIQDTVGWIYVKQDKNYKKGIELLKKAYAISLDEEIKEHLITALTLSGQTEEANALKNQ